MSLKPPIHKHSLLLGLHPPWAAGTQLSSRLSKPHRAELQSVFSYISLVREHKAAIQPCCCCVRCRWRGECDLVAAGYCFRARNCERAGCATGREYYRSKARAIVCERKCCGSRRRRGQLPNARGCNTVVRACAAGRNRSRHRREERAKHLRCCVDSPPAFGSGKTIA